MALYTQLPVYKVTYDLLLLLFAKTDGLPKSYKYTIGERLKNELLDLLLLVYRANKTSSSDKMVYIDNARICIERVRLYIRILKDSRIWSLNMYLQINLQVEEVSKQLSGWYAYALKHRVK